MSELLAAERLLGSRRHELQINLLGIDESGNRLQVTMGPSGDAAAISGLVSVPVQVSVGAAPTPASCTNNSCSPYRGGITIIGAEGRQLCTWGFYGTRGSAAKYVLTAGHCAAITEVLRVGSPNEVTFTDGVERNTFQMLSSLQPSDSLVAHVLASPNAVAPFNTIWASGTDQAHTITAKRSYSSQAVGDPVCFEGTVTGTSLCGVIAAKGQSYSLVRYDGAVVDLYNQTLMSRVGKIGDSGGPVYQSHTAYGMVSALQNGTGQVLYSSIDYVESNMATQICLTSSC